MSFIFIVVVVKEIVENITFSQLDVFVSLFYHSTLWQLSLVHLNCLGKYHAELYFLPEFPVILPS